MLFWLWFLAACFLIAPVTMLVSSLSKAAKGPTKMPWLCGRITHHGGYSLLWGLWWSWPTWAPCSTEGARLSPSKILHFWQEQQAHQVQFYQKAVEQPGITGNGVSNETVHQNGSSVYKENGSEGKLISAETAEEVEEPLMFNTRKESQLTAIKSWTRSWDLTLG